MDLSTGLSIIALIVAVGSFAVTIWATRISDKAFKQAIDVQTRSDEKEFERTRTDLLNQIADSRSILDKTRIEIGAVKANFDVEPPGVQSLLKNYVPLFTEYLPSIERAVKDCDALWQDVSSWTKEKGHGELMQAKATSYRTLKDDEVVQESAVYAVNVFKEKLGTAKERFRLSQGGESTTP
jgi:hypothetical protein